MGVLSVLDAIIAPWEVFAVLAGFTGLMWWVAAAVAFSLGRVGRGWLTALVGLTLVFEGTGIYGLQFPPLTWGGLLMHLALTAYALSEMRSRGASRPRLKAGR